MNVDEDNILMNSQFYPGVCQMVPQQGDVKPRRRRRKSNKGGEDGNTLLGKKKRKLSVDQANFLEMNFGDEHKLESERKDRLAAELGLDPRQVAVWFQNRRARWKTKKLEEEYNKLKNAHENVLLEKFRLESEMLEMKAQIIQKDKEIQMLSERVDGVCSSISPTSSISVDPINTPFLGDFGVETGYITDYSYVNSVDQWINLYM